MNYTVEQTEKIIEEYVANPTRETVNEIATRLEKSVRSVVGKLSSAGVYKTPERTTKTGETIIKKEEFVRDICTWLGVEAPTLLKTGKQDLKVLHGALQDFFEGLNDD